MGQERILVSAFQRPKSGKLYCGDSYFYKETENEFICVLADGLGSGEFAMESSRAVIDIIKSNINVPVEELIEKCNKVLNGKRGVVLGILKIDFLRNRYSISTIGNIGIITITKDRKKYRNIPSAGYLAGFKRPIKVENHDLKKGTNFIMFSDGVKHHELTKVVLGSEDVNSIIEYFSMTLDYIREDDTTLIAMRYPE